MSLKYLQRRDDMKLSKAAKARVKRLTPAERKAVAKACILLADCELITSAKCNTIIRSMQGAYNNIGR